MNVRAHPIAAAFVLLVTAGSGFAQRIPDRATLYSILGSSYIEEDFEALVLQLPQLGGFLGPVLDRTSLFDSQGPDLVAPGCTYSCPDGNLLWGPLGFQLFASGAILPQSPSGTIVATYAWPVTAVGLDVVWPGIGSGPATVTFRDGAGATIGQISVPGSVPNLRMFVGWQHAAGIGSVEVFTSGLNWRAGIDDHAYLLDPAQASWREPYGSGCNETYASFYERTESFDLSNTSLLLDNLGDRFAVLPGTAPVVPATGAPTSIPVGPPTAFPLGWTLPYPGGTTDTLYIGVRGYVRYTPDPTFELELLTSGPVVSARAAGYNLGTGAVTFESDPIAQTATITFANMAEWNAPGISTFQYHFDGAGDVEMRFGSCAPNRTTTGWSPGANNRDPGSVDISASAIILPSDRDRIPLALTGGDYPILGETVDLTIEQIPPGSVGTLHILGLTEILPGIELVSIGMPDCFAHTSLDFGHVTASPGITATYGFAVPNQVNLVGQSLLAQGFAYDPAGDHNAFGGLTSNGVRLVIGRF